MVATRNIKLYYDGSAVFAGGELQIFASGSIRTNGQLYVSDTIQLNADGSATFAGAIDTLLPFSPGTDQNASQIESYVRSQRKTADGPSAAVFAGYQGTNKTPTSKISADGSATLAGGNVELRNFDDDYGTVAIRNTGGNQFYLTYAESDVLGLTARSGTIANQTQTN